MEAASNLRFELIAALISTEYQKSTGKKNVDCVCNSVTTTLEKRKRNFRTTGRKEC